MDKLERYLDQVCRSIGGPRSLRRHVRRELREHLLDAAAGHRAAGMSDEAALERALEDFGGPEQVRAELEATHGHRLLPVVLDKAMQWKEATMRAKWLWAAWAYLAAVAVIGMNILFLAFAGLLLLPKLQKFESEGWVHEEATRHPTVLWLSSFLDGVVRVGGHAVWWALGLAAAWGLFEWRVRSENKPLMRLAALGTAALVLSVAVLLTGAALVLPFELGIPGMVRTVVRPLAAEQLASLDSSVAALEQAAGKKDWEATRAGVSRAAGAVDRLEAAAPAVLSHRARVSSSEMRARLRAAKESLGEAERATEGKDAARLEAALGKFRAAYAKVRDAADSEK